MGRPKKPLEPSELEALLAARRAGYSVKDAALLAGVPYGQAWRDLTFEHFADDEGPEPFRATKWLTMADKERLQERQRLERRRRWALRNPELAMRSMGPEALEALFEDSD